MIFKALTVFLSGAAGMLAVKRAPVSPRAKPLCWLLFVLPFWAGGFGQFSCGAVSAFLLAELFRSAKQQKGLTLQFTHTLIAAALLTLFSGAAVFWAADRGMAAWGFVRYLPVLLFVLALLQLTAEERNDVYVLVPVSGAAMTLFTFGLQWVPGVGDLVTVAGRLAGMFEYPNAFAAFLIAGLVISGTEPERNRFRPVLEGILIFGVFQSGSRLGFLVMLVILTLLMLGRRSKVYCLSVTAALALCLGLSILPGLLGLETSAHRFLSISGNSSTMLGRFLYYLDALPLILIHPLGLGYLGYHAVQGSIQTGVYDVTSVHSWLLQLLLDTGWIPAAAFCWAVARSFFTKGTSLRSRLLLLAILGHSLMDMDLEFLLFWLLVLPACGALGGTPMVLRKPQALAAAGTAAVALCLWLGIGDGLYRMGQPELCLKVTPFHTQALEYRLTRITEAQALDAAADRVLAYKPTSSIAHSAKAKAAFAMGRIDQMIPEKLEAIACARYSLPEYCDYMDMLLQARNWYLSMDSRDGAQICQAYLLEIPNMLTALQEETSSLAWRLTDQPQLELPEAYRAILDTLS